MRIARHIGLALICAVALGANSQAATKVKVVKTKTTMVKTTTAPVGDVNVMSARAKINALRDAVNKRDAAGAAALWTPDGAYLDDVGNRYAGRDALQKMFAEIFSAQPNSAPAELMVANIHAISNDVISADGIVRVGGQAANRFALTLVKGVGNDWLISSAMETPILPPVAQVAEPLSNLGWLVGSWHAEHDGGVVDMKAEWIGHENFIYCRYDIAKNPQSHEIEAQIIGWDPQSQKPISWHFDANGGYGEGYWHKAGDKWIVEVESTARNGATVNATTVLSDLKADGFTWQSVDRRVDGALLQDTAPLSVTRAK